MSVSNQTPLMQLAQVLVYFTEWEEYVAKCDLPTQCMLSVECRDDLKSYILGLTGFVNEFLCRYPMCSVKLDIVNSDVAEIFFPFPRFTSEGELAIRHFRNPPFLCALLRAPANVLTSSSSKF